MPFSVSGPKGRLIVRTTTAAKLAKSLGRLVTEHGKVTIGPAAEEIAAKKQPAKTHVPAAKPKPEPRPVSPVDANAEIRAKIVEFCGWGIKNEPQIHYAQDRPMERLRTVAALQQLPRTCDCSEFATDAYAWAGAPDPNGENYNGTGNTRTLLQHMHHIEKSDAKPGDLVVFGATPGHHVVILLEPGHANNGDPVVCSHGQERGPIEIRLSQEQAAQPLPATFLTVL